MRSQIGFITVGTIIVGAVALLVASTAPAAAHGLVGKRFFPATLVVDDPFVADELGFPTVSHIKSPARGEEPATKETEFSFELAKRITRDFGLSLEGELVVLDREHLGTLAGFRNLEIGVKYQLIKSDPHEFILTLGTGWEVGGTGRKVLESPSFDTVKPAILFGKGFGDLPDKLEFFKPLALTGFVGADIPTRTSTTNTKITFDSDSGEFEVEKEIERNPNVFRWGLVLEYSLPYLQQFVRDVGLPVPFNRIIPLVEVDFQHPLDRGQAGKFTGTVNPGFIWAGRFIQLGLEATIPVNDRTGKNVGVRGQVHFFIDDIFPNSLGRPLFGK